jgi:hypothetical protein
MFFYLLTFSSISSNVFSYDKKNDSPIREKGGQIMSESESESEHNEGEVSEQDRIFLDLQKTVARIANRAVVFSVLWLGGIGSIFAIYFGLKCLKQIKTADVELKGKGKALFGITFGIVGVLLFTFLWYGVITGQVSL